MVLLADDLMATGDEGDERKACDKRTVARDASAAETAQGEDGRNLMVVLC